MKVNKGFSYDEELQTDEEQRDGSKEGEEN
jgi:hypothetical protein